jgi:hypothetical protein
MAESSAVRWGLLVGLGLVLLAVVGALVYGRLAGPAAPPPMAGAVGGEVTARQSFAPAAELAAQWQEDARLAVISCLRPTVGVHSGREVEWTFQFFSPSTQRLALVAVAGGAARMVRDSVSPYMVPTFSAETWRVDSDQALQTWWDRGGRTLVTRRPDTDLALRLSVPGGEGEHPVWTIAGLVAGTETVFTVTVDATNGEFVGQ